VRIGNHVWLALHVQVLKGVTIGDDSIVGVRSVVTHSLPAGVVAFGVPARAVRTNVTWDRRRITAEGVER
jgi:acetyltransferase-like isoleucine patch superfamily enzyme